MGLIVVLAAGRAMSAQYLGGVAIEAAGYGVGGRIVGTDPMGGGDPVARVVKGGRSGALSELTVDDRLVFVR